ncbi:NADH dehydrogenase [ubiquinone] 1 alpha subcomplex assembly factor 8 [Plecturocebus cupreus]
MSANGAVWGRVRSRFRAFPGQLAACGAEVRSPGRVSAAGQEGPSGVVTVRKGGDGNRGPHDPRPSPPQAAAYGRCVQASTAPGGRLSKDLCAREFEALRSCFAAAVGGRGPLRALPLQEPAGPGFPLFSRWFKV